MVRRGVRWIALLALVASLWAGFAVSTTAASPIYVREAGNDASCNGQVDVDYSGTNGPNCAVATLSKAVSLADSGGMVRVAAGTYAGSATINKALTLQGAQAGVDARTRTGSESIVDSITITSSDVTVDGFSFRNPGAQISITSSTTLSNIVLQNNIFDGYGSVGLPTNNAGNLLVQQNVFRNALPASESIQIKANSDPGGCSGSQVRDNTFVNATNNGGADVNFTCTQNDSSNITVSGNITSGNSNDSSFVSFSGVVGGVTVTGNLGNTSGSSIFFFGDVSGIVDISGNGFLSGAGSAVSIHGGDLIPSDVVNTGTFNITGNAFIESKDGIFVADGSLGTGAQVHAHFNVFLDSSESAVNNASTTTIDATNNWWGCNTGPNTTGCDATTGLVTTDPWLTLTVSSDPSTISPIGYPGNVATISAGLTINSDGVDTSGSGHVFDSIPVTFATTNGTLAATSETTTDGVASTTLTSTSTPGSADVSATVDAQTVSTTVDWKIPSATTGAHVAVVNIGRPLLRLTATATPNGARGGVYFVGSDRTVIIGLRLTNVVVSGNEATITGHGIVVTRRGVRTVSFMINLTDGGSSNGGTFEIRLSNGYDSGVIPVSAMKL